MGDAGNTIWPHRWGFSPTVQHDGKWVYEYTMIAEKQGTNYSAMGVMAHELAHGFMDWPDLYDTGAGDGLQSSEGLGDYDLMAGGSWNYQNGETPGSTPAPPGAFLRLYSGFTTATTLTANSANTISNTDNGSEIYKFAYSATDYFLIENRNNTVGYDKGLFYTYGWNASAGGLLITHINESLIASCWNTNTCNDNPANYLVDVEEASGTQHLQSGANRGQANDTFYSGNVAAFNDTTTPNAKSTGGANSGLDLNAISAAGATMTFNNGTPAAPVVSIDMTGTFALGTVSTDDAAADRRFTYTIENTGNQNLIPGSVSLTAGNTADASIFAQTCTATNPLTPSATCTVTVEIDPVAAGSRSVTLTASFADPSFDPVSAEGDITYTAEIGDGAWQAAAPFASTTVGDTTQKTFTFENTGDATLAVTTSAALSGTHAADFSINASSCTTAASPVAAGGTCTVTVDFTPSATGARNATLTVVTDDPDTPSAQLAISGVGLAPAQDITPSTTSLTLGSATVGASTTATLTIDNDGGQDLTIGTVSISGAHASDFSASSALNNQIIAPGGSADLVITFSPSATGARGATLAVPSNDPDEATVSITLAGTGNPTAADIDLSATDLDYGAKAVGSSTAKTVTIENLGMATLTVTGITLTGADADQFTANGDCVGSIAGGGSCVETVTFAPDTPGTFAASLDIASNDVDEATVSVDLAATATEGAEPNIVITPVSVDFGDVTVGESASEVITVTNTGDADLTVTGQSWSGSPDFGLGENTCNTPVAPDAACTFTLVYTPTDASADSASYYVTSDDSDEPMITVSLAGTGVAPAVPMYTITASAGIGGSITPAGTFSVAHGGSKTFALSYDEGYNTAAVDISDGNAAHVSVTGTTVTLSNVTGNNAVTVTYSNTTSIVVDAGGGGGCAAANTPAGGEALAVISLLLLLGLRFMSRRSGN